MVRRPRVIQHHSAVFYSSLLTVSLDALPMRFPGLRVAATAAWHAARPWPPSGVLFCVAGSPPTGSEA